MNLTDTKNSLTKNIKFAKEHQRHPYITIFTYFTYFHTSHSKQTTLLFQLVSLRTHIFSCFCFFFFIETIHFFIFSITKSFSMWHHVFCCKPVTVRCPPVPAPPVDALVDEDSVTCDMFFRKRNYFVITSWSRPVIATSCSIFHHTVCDVTDWMTSGNNNTDRLSK